MQTLGPQRFLFGDMLMTLQQGKQKYLESFEFLHILLRIGDAIL